MEQVRLALAWDSYQKNICNGLGLLQQQGEFVDMTMAADGYHVKVHQMVMSLVSPYIKDLVKSAQGSHPIIFLSNVSHSTLSSILEYVYTGEVHIAKEDLHDVLAAGRALHIKGLEDLTESDSLLKEPTQNLASVPRDKPFKKSFSLIDKLKECKDKKKFNDLIVPTPHMTCKVFVNQATKCKSEHFDLTNDDVMMDNDTHVDQNDSTTSDYNAYSTSTPKDFLKIMNSTPIQFSVSNQSGLQLIHSRFIYHLKYYRKKCKTRQWKCVDYSSSYKCPANLTTNDYNKIVHRAAKHNHPYHDKKILKKIQAGSIFTGLSDAQKEAESKKPENQVDSKFTDIETDNDDH